MLTPSIFINYIYLHGGLQRDGNIECSTSRTDCTVPYTDISVSDCITLVGFLCANEVRPIAA